MDFFGVVNLSRLPWATEKREVINGHEQICIVIPTDEAQLKRSKRGEYFFNFRLCEADPNPLMHSHEMSLVFRNNKEAQKAEDYGMKKNAQRIGHTRIMIDDRSRAISLENNMTPIMATGVICLTDICTDDIEIDPRTGKKYVRVTFQKMQYLDNFKNSHELAIVKPTGSVNIGLFREWPGASEQLSRISALQTECGPQTSANDVKITPTQIDGLKF